MRNLVLILISFAFAFAFALLGGCSNSNEQTKAISISPGIATVATVTDTTEQSFDRDVLRSKKPVLVDFYATWCGPCKLMAPVVHGIASQYAGKVKVVRVDIDRNPTLTKRYNIDAVPTIAIFNRGALTNSTVGVVPSNVIADELKEALQNSKAIGARPKNTSL